MAEIVTLGKAGRLVVPKSVRERLGLKEGTRLRLKTSPGKFELAPEPEEARIEMREDGLSVILGGPPRRRGDIVRAIKAGREELERRHQNRRPRA